MKEAKAAPQSRALLHGLVFDPDVAGSQPSLTGFVAGVPGVHLGPHTQPRRRVSDAAIDDKVRRYGMAFP